MKRVKNESKTDWKRVKSLTEKEITTAAKADPNAPLLTANQLKQFKRVQSPSEVDVKKIRKKLHLSQEQFAYYFGVKKATIQGWEQGRRKPRATARNFLKVIECEPKIVLKILNKS